MSRATGGSLFFVNVEDFNAIKKIVKFNSRFIQNALGQNNMIEIGALAGGNTSAVPAAIPAAAPMSRSSLEISADLPLVNAKVGVNAAIESPAPVQRRVRKY